MDGEVVQARAEVAAIKGQLRWQPAKSDVARSLDLGYTYGTYELKSEDGKGDESGNYVHVWKRQPDGKWKLALELFNPIPKK